MDNHIFYHTGNGVSADFIPFYKNGRFYLFYLHDYRNIPEFGEGEPWYLITTDNFTDFTEYGEVLPRGKETEQDLHVFTGSVSEINGSYHIYYTGHNSHFPALGKNQQVIMHAVSNDLIHWEKQPEDLIAADTESYEPHDWRDPFVYYDEAAGVWRMLIMARENTGGEFAGVTARLTSADGKTWGKAETFFTEHRYPSHECPDLFRMGAWYYLIFSANGTDFGTRYRMSRSPEGPWIEPEDQFFDTRADYAAKTAERDGVRYLFGWLATRENNSDLGGWQWGGCLDVHKLVQHEDGTLGCAVPDEVAVTLNDTDMGMDVEAEAGKPLCLTNLPEVGAVKLRIPHIAENPVELRLCSDEKGNGGYAMRFDFAANTVSIQLSDTETFTRPLRNVKNGICNVLLLLDGSAACAYINNDTALSFRMYNRENSFLFAECAKKTNIYAEFISK